jgi:hypothetical protein
VLAEHRTAVCSTGGTYSDHSSLYTHSSAFCIRLLSKDQFTVQQNSAPFQSIYRYISTFLIETIDEGCEREGVGCGGGEALTESELLSIQISVRLLSPCNLCAIHLCRLAHKTSPSTETPDSREPTCKLHVSSGSSGLSPSQVPLGQLLSPYIATLRPQYRIHAV